MCVSLPNYRTTALLPCHWFIFKRHFNVYIRTAPHLTFRNRILRKILFCVGHHVTKRARPTPTPAWPGQESRARRCMSRKQCGKGGGQLELIRRRLKTWSTSEPSASLVQAPTYLYLYLHEDKNRVTPLPSQGLKPRCRTSRAH